MKKIMMLLCLLAALKAGAQSTQAVQYYFIEVRPTGRMEVELQPETGVKYADIDSLLVATREVKKNGAIIITGRKYSSLSAAFNSLAGAGLVFLQFSNINTVGGATAALVGDLRINYMIWKKDLAQPLQLFPGSINAAGN